MGLLECEVRRFQSPALQSYSNFPSQKVNLFGDDSFARPTGIWFGPILMGQILPSSIRNRVGYGFFFKNPKRVQIIFGFYKLKKFKTRPKTQPGYNPVTLKLQKTPYIYIYIAITNPKSHFF